MLSNLPKLLDRSFVLGFFFPALLFSITTLLLLQDYAFASQWLESLLAKDVNFAAYAAAAVWLLAVLLLLLNLPFYRLLEGYLPPLSWFDWGERRSWYRVLMWLKEALSLRRKYMRGLWRPADRKRYNELRSWLSRVPGQRADILPTRFGNAIKSFETYARDIYGADGVVIWLRLLPVVSKEYATAVQDVRTQVDFHVNCCVLALLLALIAFVVALMQAPFAIIWREVAYAWELTWHAAIPGDPSNRGLLTIWSPLLWLVPYGKLIWFVAACVVSRVFYCFAVSAVPAWGDLVMTGFDCYLPKLAEQLGYTLPRNDAQRRGFWRQFSALVTYRALPGEDPFFRSEDWLFPPRH